MSPVVSPQKGPKLIVGLGNPGVEYRRTRHNIGFCVAEKTADQLGVAFLREKYGGLFAEGRIDGIRVFLLKPLTFMNRSGASVARAVRYALHDVADLLVVADDVNLPLGRLRLRAGGSSGGHKGLESIIEHLGTDEFSRLRIGVGMGKGEGDLTRHVLGRFTAEEAGAVEQAVARAAEAVLVFARHGIATAMDRFNVRVERTKTTKSEAPDSDPEREHP